MTGGHSFLGIFDQGVIKMGVTNSCDTDFIMAICIERGGPI